MTSQKFLTGARVSVSFCPTVNEFFKLIFLNILKDIFNSPKMNAGIKKKKRFFED